MRRQGFEFCTRVMPRAWEDLRTRSIHVAHEVVQYMCYAVHFMNTANCEDLAVDFLRALRGRRSQRAFSRALGYRSNIAYRWESKRCWPTAAQVLQLLQTRRAEPARKLMAFADRPLELGGTTATISPRFVASFLDAVRVDRPIAELARAMGYSRTRVSRWLSGACEPRLPEFFELLTHTSARVLDFVALFFDPECLPSVAHEFRRLRAVRAAAYEAPWSHLVLRALELDAYLRLPRHKPGWLAAQLKLDLEQEQQALQLLQKAGQIRWKGSRYRVANTDALDTRGDPAGSRALRRYWIDRAGARLTAGEPGIYSYNLFSVSERDLARIREVHLRYYREIQGIVAESSPAERIGVFCTQLFSVDAQAWQGANEGG